MCLYANGNSERAEVGKTPSLLPLGNGWEKEERCVGRTGQGQRGFEPEQVLPAPPRVFLWPLM